MDPRTALRIQIITLGRLAPGMRIQPWPEFSKINSQESPKLLGVFMTINEKMTKINMSMIPCMPTWAMKRFARNWGQRRQSMHPAQFPEMSLIEPNLFYNNKHWHLLYILWACYTALQCYTSRHLPVTTTVWSYDCHQSFIQSWEHRLRQVKSHSPRICVWSQDLSSNLFTPHPLSVSL